jgi:hypothetical protein
MNSNEQKVVCKTPNPGKLSKRIAKWKYDTLRNAIHSVLKENPAGVLFNDLTKLVRDKLDKITLDRIGSLSWYTTTVKLDLEVKGEFERIQDLKPQQLRLKQ